MPMRSHRVGRVRVKCGTLAALAIQHTRQCQRFKRWRIFPCWYARTVGMAFHWVAVCRGTSGRFQRFRGDRRFGNSNDDYTFANKNVKNLPLKTRLYHAPKPFRRVGRALMHRSCRDDGDMHATNAPHYLIGLTHDGRHLDVLRQPGMGRPGALLCLLGPRAIATASSSAFPGARSRCWPWKTSSVAAARSILHSRLRNSAAGQKREDLEKWRGKYLRLRSFWS